MAEMAYSAPILTGKRLSSEEVLAIQRQKILAAAVVALDELGYERVTVAAIIARARVSRGAFYDQFADRDECLADALDEGVARIVAALEAARVDVLDWVQQVTAGVAVVFDFFDRQPSLARVLVIESLRGGPQLLARRAVMLERLAAFLDQGPDRGPRFAAVTGEVLVGAAFSVVHRRLLRGDGELASIADELSRTLLMGHLEGTSATAPGEGAVRNRRRRRSLVAVA
jgi:AcrR family transcriptional regulator